MRVKILGEMNAESLRAAVAVLQERFGGQVAGFWEANLYVQAVTEDGQVVDLPDSEFITLDQSQFGRPRPVKLSEKRLLPVAGRPKRGSQEWQAEQRRLNDASLRESMGDEAYESMIAGQAAIDEVAQLQGLCDMRRRARERCDIDLRDELRGLLVAAFLDELAVDGQGLVNDLNSLVETVWAERKPVRHFGGVDILTPVPRFEVSHGRLMLRRSPEAQFSLCSSGTPFPNGGLWKHAAWVDGVLPPLIELLAARLASKGASCDKDVGLMLSKTPILPAAFDAVSASDERYRRGSSQVLPMIREMCGLDLATASRCRDDFGDDDDDEALRLALAAIAHIPRKPCGLPRSRNDWE
jgi:hypothetical protein